MKFIVDIDGVISRKIHWTKKDIRERCPEMFLKIRPNKKVISRINELRQAGHTIILHTSRLWHDYDVTIRWLARNGVRFNQLIMAKPLGDFYIDDKNLSVKEFLKCKK